MHSGKYLHTIIFVYVCIFINVFTNILIIMYLIHKMVKSKYFYCVVNCLTITRQPMLCTQDKYWTCSNIHNPKLHYSIIFSIIHNYSCLLSPCYVHSVVTFHCIKMYLLMYLNTIHVFSIWYLNTFQSCI